MPAKSPDLKFELTPAALDNAVNNLFELNDEDQQVLDAYDLVCKNLGDIDSFIAQWLSNVPDNMLELDVRGTLAIDLLLQSAISKVGTLT